VEPSGRDASYLLKIKVDGRWLNVRHQFHVRFLLSCCNNFFYNNPSIIKN